MSIDPRANSPEKIKATFPLPMISRKALRRIKHPTAIPTECPYCKGKVELVENSEIYHGRSYGEWPYAYLCRTSDCRAYVGLHPFTDIPLGTLADKATREARNKCKPPFNAIWEGGYKTRDEAYAWLAKQLRLKPEQCHFGLMNAEQCERAFEECEKFWSKK